MPLSILATGLMMLSALSLTCGLVLDTIVRLSREQFFVRMRHFYSQEAANRSVLPSSKSNPSTEANSANIIHPECFDLEETPL